MSGEGGVTRAGTLWKLGHVHRAWRERTVELHGGERRLSYQPRRGARRDVPLAAITEVRVAADGESSRANVFFVVTAGRTYKLAAASPPEREEWVAALQLALGTATPPDAAAAGGGGGAAAEVSADAAVKQQEEEEEEEEDVAPVEAVEPVNTNADEIANTATTTTPVPTATPPAPFPSRAISLAHLLSLRDAKTIDPGWTAHQVKVEFVLPVTLATATAYTDSPAGKEHSAETNVFVSHAWQYTFGSLTAALEDWAGGRGLDPAATFAWIDLFSVNQHVSQDVTQDEWAETFCNGIRQAGAVVLVLTPWSDPVPYTRAWCLWEVFNASKVGTAFSIALPPAERESLEAAVAGSSQGIVPALCQIDSGRAKAQDPRDREMIFSWITRPTAEGGAGGFHRLNGLLLDMLREWLAATLATMMEVRSPEATWRTEREGITFRGRVAVVLHASGRLADALAMQEAVLEAAPPVFGPEDPETLVCANNLAATYCDVGRFHDAIALEEQTLATRRKVLGPHHPDTLSTLANLGVSSLHVGRLEDALRFQTEALEGLRGSDRVDPADPSLLAAWNNQISTMHRLGRFEEALAPSEALYAAACSGLGANHPTSLACSNTLAANFTALGRLHEALALKEAEVGASKAGLGEAHLQTINSIGSLAQCYWNVGRKEDTAATWEEMLRLASEGLGFDHALTLGAVNQLAAVYAHLGRPEDVLRVRRWMLDGMRDSLGADHPQVSAAIANVATALSSLHRYAEALPLNEAALAAAESRFGASHAETVIMRCNLATACNLCGQRPRAIALMHAVVASADTTFGPAHPNTAAFRAFLAKLEAAQAGEG